LGDYGRDSDDVVRFKGMLHTECKGR